jgi:hypothetical protein
MVTIFFNGCQNEDKILPAKETVKAPIIFGNKNLDHNSGGRSEAILAGEIYAFAGDNVYQINPNTRQAILYGTGWSGTEASTIINDNLFGVQGGHLWKCNLNTGVCADLGAAWGGTSFMVNDDRGFLYAIQGGRIWKVNSNNGSWVQLGIGDWSGSTSMNFHNFNGAYGNNFGYIHISQSGLVWRVGIDDGNWEFLAGAPMYPVVIGAHCCLHYANNAYGISGANLVLNSNAHPIAPAINVTGQTSWSGASDITFSKTSNVPVNSISYLWIIKNAQLFQLRYQNSDLCTTLGTVSGLTNPYQLVSVHGR